MGLSGGGDLVQTILALIGCVMLVSRPFLPESEGVHSNRLPPGPIASGYNAVLSACQDAEQWELALKIFQDEHRTNRTPGLSWSAGGVIYRYLFRMFLGDGW